MNKFPPRSFYPSVAQTTNKQKDTNDNNNRNLHECANLGHSSTRAGCSPSLRTTGRHRHHHSLPHQMNIFILDTTPFKCAEAHCDRHVVKMVLETAQILCSAAHLHGATNLAYKPTHLHHPCVQWAAASRDNYAWLIGLGNGLANEYYRRYGKVHKSADVIRGCVGYYTRIPAGGRTPFELCMPEEYKVAGDAVKSYRNYYLGAKMSFARWKNVDETPAWVKEELV